MSAFHAIKSVISARSQKIFVHHARPNEIVRSEKLKRSRHLLGVEETLFPHQIIKEAQLTLIDEELQFAGLRKVHLRRKERQRRERRHAITRQRRCRNRKQRSAKAIASPMDFCVRNDRTDRFGVIR